MRTQGERGPAQARARLRARDKKIPAGTKFPPSPLRANPRKALKTRAFLVRKAFSGSTNVLLPHLDAPAENSEVELAFAI